MGKEKTQEVPMLAAAFQRVGDLQEQIKTTNTMLYDS
jgi:hypothetical protein